MQQHLASGRLFDQHVEREEQRSLHRLRCMFGGSVEDCANCDYETCGHYVNMSAQYYTQVACGFSSLGGWSTQDFK